MTNEEYANSNYEYADLYEQQTVGHVVEAIAVLFSKDGRALSVRVKFDGRDGEVHLQEVIPEKAALSLFDDEQFYADLVELYQVNRELGSFIPPVN
jgi:hypothetical protein